MPVCKCRIKRIVVFTVSYLVSITVAALLHFFTFILDTPFNLFSFICFLASAVLRCWRCSTDVSNGEFCNDPFQPDSISEQQRYWSYVNCTYSVGVKSVNARPVCKKLVQEGKIKWVG